MEQFSKKEIKQLFYNSSKEDRIQIKEDLNELLKKFKKPSHEWTPEDHQQLKLVVNEFVKSGISPGYITDLKLENDEVALARLNYIFHKTGYTGGDKPNVEGVNSKIGLNTIGHDKEIINLEKSFGLMDEKYSTTDFGVFRKPNGDTHVVFRGSKTNPFKNPEFSEDWGYNFKAGFMDAKKTEKYNRILADLNKVVEDPAYEIKRMVGYSLGGGLAMNMGEEFGVDTAVFNPHINRTHDFNKFKQKHFIYRTNADPASLMSGGGNNNVEIKTIPTTVNSEDGLSAHELSQLTDTTTQRSRRYKLMERLQAHNRLTEFAEQLDNVMEALKRKGETLKSFLSRPAKRPRGAYRPIPTEEGFELQPPRETTTTRQVTRRPDIRIRPLARRPRGAFPVERPRTQLSFVSDPDNLEEVDRVVKGLTTGMRGKRGIRSRALAWLAANPRARINPEEIPLLAGNESGLNSNEVLRFGNSDPEIRSGTREYLQRRINASYSDIDTEYMAPMRNSARLGGFN